LLSYVHEFSSHTCSVNAEGVLSEEKYTSCKPLAALPAWQGAVSNS
jgi:hypothetical protein